MHGDWLARNETRPTHCPCSLTVTRGVAVVSRAIRLMESSKEKRAKKRKELPVKQRKQDDELVAQEEPDDADASLPMEIDGVESSSCLQLRESAVAVNVAAM